LIITLSPITGSKMDKPRLKDLQEAEAALEDRAQEKYILRLYVAGMTPNSLRAIDNLKKICEEHLIGRYELEVIDLYQQPVLAIGEQIIAAPTLIKKLPLPLRKVIGDMTNVDRVLVGLDLRSKAKASGKR
jgi:circadian clock protein KaiB